MRDLNGLMNSVKQSPGPVAVIIDNAVPQISAIETLESIRAAGVKSRRILITDYCDLGIIVQGLHTGAIERIVYKPIHSPELLGAIGSENLPTSIITPPVAQARTSQSRGVG
jgi:FixJ family two-component response regulator